MDTKDQNQLNRVKKQKYKLGTSADDLFVVQANRQKQVNNHQKAAIMNMQILTMRKKVLSLLLQKPIVVAMGLVCCL